MSWLNLANGQTLKLYYFSIICEVMDRRHDGFTIVEREELAEKTTFLIE